MQLWGQYQCVTTAGPRVSHHLPPAAVTRSPDLGTWQGTCPWWRPPGLWPVTSPAVTPSAGLTLGHWPTGWAPPQRTWALRQHLIFSLALPVLNQDQNLPPALERGLAPPSLGFPILKMRQWDAEVPLSFEVCCAVVTTQVPVAQGTQQNHPECQPGAFPGLPWQPHLSAGEAGGVGFAGAPTALALPLVWGAAGGHMGPETGTPGSGTRHLQADSPLSAQVSGAPGDVASLYG